VRGLDEVGKNRALNLTRFLRPIAGASTTTAGQRLMRSISRLKGHFERLLIFGDLLLHMVTIFQQARRCLGQYQQLVQIILVANIQDTKRLQYNVLRLLASGSHRIFAGSSGD